MKEVQADVICGQEHNLDTTQSCVRSIIFATTQQHWNRSRVIFGTTPIPFVNRYKPGGTFQVTVNNGTSRIVNQSKDKWGRWVLQTFQGKEGRRVTIVTAYQVVTDVTPTGSITAATQQRSLLIQAQDRIQQPRAAFRHDLLQCLTELRESGDEILLIGDFNEQLGSDPDGMSRIVCSLSLVDALREYHSQEPPATYARGSRCLDYALATASVADSISRCGYEAFNSRYPSDHRGLYIDFDIDKLFGTALHHLAKHQPRMLQSKNVNQVTDYIRRKHQWMTQHNIFARVKKLSRPRDQHQLAERLDKDLVAASLFAEAKTRKMAEPMWSNALATARKRVQLLKKCVSQQRTRLSAMDQIQHDWKALRLHGHPPSDLRGSITALHQATRDVQKLVKESYTRRDEERQRRIEELENTGNREHARVLRQQKRAERTRMLFRKLQTLRARRSPKHGCPELKFPYTRKWIPKSVLSGRLSMSQQT